MLRLLFRKAFSGGHYVVMCCVFTSYVAALATFLFGAYRMGANSYHLMTSLFHPSQGLPTIGVEMISVLDTFLLATVLYVFAVGMYELFVGRLGVPQWLLVKDLPDLKEKLISVVITIMAVTFLEHLVKWQDPMQTLQFAGAIALMAGVLVMFNYFGSKTHEVSRGRRPEATDHEMATFSEQETVLRGRSPTQP